MPSPYFDKGGITLYHGDFREIIPTIEDVDVVITDPPLGDASDGMSPPEAEYRSRLDAILNARADYIWILAKVIQTNKVPLLEFLSENAHYILDVGVWIKTNREKFEYLFAMSKIRPRTQGFWPPGHMFEAGDPEHNSISFPPMLPEMILDRFGGCSVLDPCVGNGTTLFVAKKLGLRGIGVEINEKRCEEMARILESDPEE